MTKLYITFDMDYVAVCRLIGKDSSHRQYEWEWFRFRSPIDLYAISPGWKAITGRLDGVMPRYEHCELVTSSKLWMPLK